MRALQSTLKQTRRFDKGPFDAELLCDFLSKRLNSKYFCGVVAAGVKIKPELLRHIKVVLSQFTGNEGVDLIGLELINGALPTASKDCDALGLFAAVFDSLISAGE